MGAALLAEGRAWLAALRPWQLYALLLVLAVGLVAAVQLPLRYRVDVGVGEGYGGDLPLLRGFNTAEEDSHGSYRWTADNAEVRFPGVGTRPLLLRMSFFPVGGLVVEQGPKVIEVWSRGAPLATLPVRPEGATYNLPIPAALVRDGDLLLTIRTATFAPGGDDPRRLGTPLDRIELIGLAPVGLAWPNWGSLLQWAGALVLLWASVLRAGFRPKGAFVGLLVAVAAALLAAVLDPPRFAFGAGPVLATAALGYGLLLALRAILPPLAHRFAVPLDARALSWLLLIIVVAFGMRYGGRLYPDSMGGDIGFHYNRMTEVIKGRVFLLSRNRGVDFPYPPGPYLALAPLTTLGIGPRTLLQLGAAVVEGVSAALVYALVAGTISPQRRKDAKMVREKGLAGVEQGDEIGSSSNFSTPLSPSIPPRLRASAVNPTALLAAALYVFTAAGFMTTWWSFDTHIYTQFTSLLLTTTVLLSARSWGKEGPTGPQLGAIWLLLAGVFLGHFGFFINTVLLGGGLLALLWLLRFVQPQSTQNTQSQSFSALRALRLDPAFLPHLASTARRLTLVYIGAGLAAALLFYSAFLPLFLAQAEAAASGGLTGLAQRAPVPRSVLWDVLWEAGIVVHFGFFPLLLAPLGLWLCYASWQRSDRAQPAPGSRFSVLGFLFVIALGSFLVSSLFAILPFITQSTQSTRWLMFSAWAICVMAAIAAQALWHCGRVGKLVVLAMGGYVLWNTLALWLGALAWRIRPPEPF